MKRISPASPSLQDLILLKMREKGLSKYDLARSIGYPRNTTKGIRRLNEYLGTLQAPSEEFIINLLSALEIDGWNFYKAVSASSATMNAKADSQAKNAFKPHIQVLVNDNPSPAFAAQILYSQRKVEVPEELQALPFHKEIEAVLAIHKNHVHSLASENISRRKLIYGFKYHRKHNYYIEFDIDFNLKEVQFLTAIQGGKKEFGGKFVDLLLNHREV